MRRLAATLVLCVLALGLAAGPGDRPAWAAPQFLAGTEDVPLMPGLASDESSLVVFDNPQGRIVEVEARGQVRRVAVERFYAQSLPQLGWTKAGHDSWQREGERLKLDFKGRDGNLRVGFTLSPR